MANGSEVERHSIGTECVVEVASIKEGFPSSSRNAAGVSSRYYCCLGTDGCHYDIETNQGIEAGSFLVLVRHHYTSADIHWYRIVGEKR